MTFRSAIPDFQLANPLYAGAVVSFWTVDVNGVKTAVLANLFAGPTGATQVPNPQILDAEGKFPVAVYHSVPVIAEVESDSSDTVETGIILPYVGWRGNWTTATLLDGNNLVKDPVTNSVYIATNTFVTSGSIANDVAAGNLELIIQGENATIASNAAAAAADSATAADASADAAAALLATTARTQAAGTTNGIVMQSGTTAQRVTPGAGVIVVRYNTTTSKLEMYATTWGALVRALGDIGDVDLTTTPPVAGDSLVYNGTGWAPGGLNISAVNGDIIPGTTNTRDLGSLTKVWNEVFATNFRADAFGNKAATSSIPSDTLLQGTMKNWLNLNGTGTIAVRDSFNVSSVVDNGVGDYTVNMSAALPNANYGCAYGVAGTGGVVTTRGLDDVTARTSSLYRINTLNTTFNAADVAHCFSSVAGDP